MMADLPDHGRSPRYKTPKENLKVGCANRAGGQAADQFVSLTAHPLNVTYRSTHAPRRICCQLRQLPGPPM